MRKIGFIAVLFLLIHCQNKPVGLYTFRGTDLCYQADGEVIRSVERDSVVKFGRERAFAKKIFTTNDSILISFKAISAFCLQPADSIIFTHNQIVIRNKFSGEHPCECLCDYEYRYAVAKAGNAHKKIVVQ